MRLGGEDVVECRVRDSGLFQVGIDACTEVFDKVCVDISCGNESMQASMVVLETVVKGHSLIITDVSAMDEAVAY